jgi:hypothetical protein
MEAERKRPLAPGDVEVYYDALAQDYDTLYNDTA